MSLRVGFLRKASCGIQGRLVGPGATNRAEAVCTAWLIIGWKVYRCYTRDGRGGKARQREAERQRRKVEKDDEVM